MRFRILFGVATVLTSLATAGATGLVGTASAAPGYTCTGGNFAKGHFTSIPSGTYSSITIEGACNIVPNAVINVTGNINVAAGAVLDAQSAPSTITVGRNVTAGAGSILGMGCQPKNTIGMFAGVPCKIHHLKHTVITVNGNITATAANTVLLRQLTVGGNINLTGGGGELPWSIKGNTVGGSVAISGVTPEWLGLQFNTIAWNATLTNISITDTDPNPAVAVVENTVGNNLKCTGLAPAVTGGFIPGEVNHVGNKALGQCADLV